MLASSGKGCHRLPPPPPQEDTTGRLHHLSQTIIEDLPLVAWEYILNRSSIKMVVQYRTVCKAWLRIIDLLYSWKDLHPEETRTFGCSDGDGTSIPVVYALTRKGDEAKVMRIATFPELRGFVGKARSTCNGLILFQRRGGNGDSRILESAVVNPLTGEAVKVPGSPYRPVLFDNLALGFDHFTNSYKLVQLHVLDERNELGAAIYDFGRRSWKYCGDPHQTLLLADGAIGDEGIGSSDGICVLGSLYWILHGKKRRTIVSFDLGHGEFRLTSMPPGFHKRKYYKRTELMNVAGKLAVCDLSLGHMIVITTMDGVRGWNWRTGFTIFLDGPTHSADDVTSLHSDDQGRILIRGVVCSSRERWLVLRDLEDRFFKCSTKEGFPRSVDVYCDTWNMSSFC